MEIYIIAEILNIAYGILTGILIGTVYVLFSFLRQVLKTGIILTALSDIIFGILAAIAVFAFTFIFNSGIIRAYILGAIIMGFAIPLLIHGKLRLWARQRKGRRRRTDSSP